MLSERYGDAYLVHALIDVADNGKSSDAFKIFQQKNTLLVEGKGRKKLKQTELEQAVSSYSDKILQLFQSVTVYLKNSLWKLVVEYGSTIAMKLDEFINRLTVLVTKTNTAKAYREAVIYFQVKKFIFIFFFSHKNFKKKRHV